MGDFFSYEWIPILLNMSLTASAVILCVLLVRLALRRAPRVFSYALWAVVLFRLLCPVSLTAGFSLLGLADVPVRAAAAHATVVEYVPQDVVHAPEPQVVLPVPDAVNDALNTALPQGAEQTAADPLEAPTAIAALVWLAGVLAMAGYSAVSLIRLRRRLAGAVPLEGNVWLADHISTPFVLGLLRPRIYLPSSLPEGERGYILLHERHHIRRLDHLAKVLAFLALCIHWFNPLVWLSFLLMGRDMEMSCDEAVLRQLGEDARADYSASLLSLATGRRIIAGAPLAFGEGDTGSRIRNVLRWRRPRLRLAVPAAVICAAAIAACAANPAAQDKSGMGQYASMEAFAQEAMSADTAVYYTADGREATARVTAAKLAWLDKKGEVKDLDPNGTLEAWTFHYLVQVDADDVMLVGGMYEEDGWYDLEGQGGRNLVALRYPDGSYDILYNSIVNDNLAFWGYHNSYEEAIYDWYVTDQGLNLPLYVENWGNDHPARRFDGEGWYLYIPVANWEPVQVQEDGTFLWRSAYGTGASLSVRYADDPPAQDEAAGTWVCPAPEGGAYVVQAVWPAPGETEAEQLYAAEEAEELRRMAERFVVDRSVGCAPPPRAADLTEALNAVVEGSSLTLRLYQDGWRGIFAGGWQADNALYHLGRLQRAAWEPWPEGAPDSGTLLGRAQVTLATGTGFSLTAWEGLEAAQYVTSGGSIWVSPAPGEEQPPLSLYEDLRGWYDETEFLARGGEDRQGEIVISGWRRSYLDAAAAYAEAYAEPYLQVTKGSKYRCTVVQTGGVEPAEEETAWLRAEGLIGEDTWCFRLTAVFVPENDRARNWSMAGNTGAYTGSDPRIPDGALETRLCGHITWATDGWHGEIVGTGW